MSADLARLERIRVLAAEEIVIDSIPKNLVGWLDEANEKFAANGGCPGCGSKLIALHTLPCSVYSAAAAIGAAQ